VVTAKHCVKNLSITEEVGFAIGPNSRQPVKVVPIVVTEWEQGVSGGFISMGSDVAVAHLEAPINDVQPFAIGTALAQADVSTRFVAMGYGSQDIQGTSGTRKAGSMTLKGTEGKVFELAFGSFDAFKKKIPEISDIAYLVGDPNTPQGEQRAREIYDGRTLIKDYEAYLGNGAGDAQTCHGDSGGPLIRRVNGKSTVFGVVSWGHHRTGSFCDHGGVFASFGPKTQDFLTAALAWVDPCDGMSSKGSCDGDVAVRCSARVEGVRRILRTDCAELGLTCGTGSDGQVDCVE
jgi:hypothetical protein